jgi:hypothetical protein
MAVTTYRGFTLTSTKTADDFWQISIKKQVLTGNLADIKKTIDWWCDTGSVVSPRDLAQMSEQGNTSVTQQHYHGFTLQNDSGNSNGWYCLFNGRLIKGANASIKKHIDAYLVAKQKAEQSRK